MNDHWEQELAHLSVTNETNSERKRERERFCADTWHLAGRNWRQLAIPYERGYGRAMNKINRFLPVLALASLSLLGTSAHAAGVDCKLKFTMSGWSAIYKRADGTGTVTCNNGQSMHVKLAARGGGLSAGKSTIRNGVGEFSSVQSIDDVLGSYASAEAHAGAVKSAQGQVVTKGEISLALSGTGEGWDLGIAFGKFTIKKQ
jgi:hypothetical protein